MKIHVNVRHSASIVPHLLKRTHQEQVCELVIDQEITPAAQSIINGASTAPKEKIIISYEPGPIT